MSPKTPITPFRLTKEDRERLARLSQNMGTSMTEAVRVATRAMDQFTQAIKAGGLDSREYPFEAHTEAVRAFRDASEEQMSQQTMDAIDAAVAAAWPIICQDKIDAERRRVLVDTIQRLEGFEVDPDVIKHFWGLLNAHDEQVRAAR